WRCRGGSLGRLTIGSPGVPARRRPSRSRATAIVESGQGSLDLGFASRDQLLRGLGSSELGRVVAQRSTPPLLYEWAGGAARNVRALLQQLPEVGPVPRQQFLAPCAHQRQPVGK